MRQEIIDYIQTLDIGSFNVSNELPWEESGTPLYIKNLKKIYVDVDQFEIDPFIQTFSGLNINNETTVVRIFFANDAKNLPPNYSDVVSELRTAKDIEVIQGFNRREALVSTEVQADRLVTELELRFTKISK
jgi:hypothetical protein